MRDKQYFIDFLNEHPYIAAVGRIRDWLTDPHSDRYPVSCTIFNVEDSMEGTEGIESAWLYTSKALRYAAGVGINLSELRSNGTENGKGLISSGAVGFLSILSRINEILRRGGKFKNGAVVGYIDSYSGDLPEWLGMSYTECLKLPATLFYPYTPFKIPPKDAEYDTSWAKRALYVSDDPNSKEYLLNHPLLDYIIRAMKAGTVWLSKKQWDKEGNRLYSQVCMEILLKSRGTCLLTHVNLGQINDLDQIPDMFENSMKFLCELHGSTDLGQGENSQYLSSEVDRQVGLGVLGLANLLANYKVTYSEFVECLGDFAHILKKYEKYEPNMFNAVDFLMNWDNTNAYKIVEKLYTGYHKAAAVAKAFKMDRAFTIAPTATCSYKNVDFNGYTTAPEISPPIAHPITKVTVRDSGMNGTIEYSYPPSVEVAESVEFETYYNLVDLWYRVFLSVEGLDHAISFNLWDTLDITQEWIEKWLKSAIKTTYYRKQVRQSAVDKSTIATTEIDLETLENIKTSNQETVEESDETFSHKLNWLREEVSETPTCTLPKSEEDFCPVCAE